MAEVSLQELLETGAHFGHQARRWNPKMKQYIYKVQDGVHVINLSETARGLKEAVDYVEKLIAANGKVMFVGTKRQAKDLIKSKAVEVSMPFVAERWVGGMLTNWDTITKNIRRYKDFKKQQENGELAKYTKKEQSLIGKEMERLERIYEGMLELNGIPDAMFVVDCRKEKIAVQEARRRGIIIIGVCDTNTDPVGVDIVIPANDDAFKSIEYIINKIGEGVLAGQNNTKDKTEKPLKKEASVTKEEKAEEKPTKTRKKKTETQDKE